MAINPVTYQYVSQLGLQRLIDVSTGPDGPHGVTAFWLVPAGGWHNNQRFPHDIDEDLGGAGLTKTTVEGQEYYLVPEESSNLPGRLSHYAQLTGVAELANPPGNGVNRVRATLENTAEATVAPDAVAKYVEDNDSWEEARKKVSDEDARTARQVSVSPAREPAEGKLVVAEQDNTPAGDSDTTGTSKAKSEKQVKPTGDTKA
jgi:hypothetical protein